MTGKDRSSGGMYKLNPDSKTRRDRPSGVYYVVHSMGDWPARRILGPACPSSTRTWLSDKRSDSPVRADRSAHQQLGQASSTTGRTAMSENCPGRPVR
ncbi:hypothetical protein PGT21_029682 [Puccinia graminis f. sp. tritici]|uniref:Uncharacterized protein n=1 Tax=Puccinia graminis f. sp. tritici TaxID=56615 RepID=A0A5B0LKW8_PUCGR|nr:hypothetical protein PGT21_001174 [Puccinia graminis f. sp. tritici]KAA1094777.1 hypothetical protein PGT21_029682 [Puccinia graminis f. sp. tritici]